MILFSDMTNTKNHLKENKVSNVKYQDSISHQYGAILGMNCYAIQLNAMQIVEVHEAYLNDDE